MPNQYVPTGRPRGRPRIPAVEKLGIKDVVPFLKETTVDRSSLVLDGRICPDCFPDGWPNGMHATGCSHGTWVRR